MSRRNDAVALATVLGATLGVGLVGALVTKPALKPWYAGLRKPPLTPPPVVFAPVWTTLYSIMAISSWLVWKSSDSRKHRALAWYGGQLALNLAWSPLFFGAKKPLVALFDMLLLNAALAQTVNRFRSINKQTALMLRPYQAWVAFATYLNAGLVVLNIGKRLTNRQSIEQA